MKSERILVADDTPANIALVVAALEPHGFEVLTAFSGDEALRVAARANPDLILLDVMMPDRNGFDVCRALKEHPALADVPVLFITAKTDAASVVDGFRAGGIDYIAKPFHQEEVVSRVTTHLRISRLARELQERNAELEKEVAMRRQAERARDAADQQLSTLTARENQRWGLSGFIGNSPHLRQILDDIERLHHFDKTTVLITGESGTGKELVARAIHHASPRAAASFIAVNCVAIPAELAESVMFGHVKGSFTGALADRKGYFELADGGTLFLDEIGDMPLALQAKLLRVLEDGEVMPVGATQPRRANVRVIAATNANLAEKIADGSFRQDLYFRLARYTVHTPPLRDRPEDVPLIAAHFLEVFATEMGRPTPDIAPGALEMLSGYAFPGNIRELKNCIERGIILSGGGTIRPQHLQLLEPLPTRPLEPRLPVSSKKSAAAFTENLPLNLEAAEQALIERALAETDGNVAEAARLLGVNRSRIYRRFVGSRED